MSERGQRQVASCCNEARLLGSREGRRPVAKAVESRLGCQGATPEEDAFVLGTHLAASSSCEVPRANPARSDAVLAMHRLFPIRCSTPFEASSRTHGKIATASMGSPSECQAAPVTCEATCSMALSEFNAACSMLLLLHWDQLIRGEDCRQFTTNVFFSVLGGRWRAEGAQPSDGAPASERSFGQMRSMAEGLAR